MSKLGFIRRVGGFHAYTAMDYNTDTIHVLLDDGNEEKTIYTIDYSGNMFDKDKKQIGKFSLDENRNWKYETNVFLVKSAYSIDLPESILDFEVVIVQKYLKHEIGE